jgi:N-carbamoylputrescine amidase
MHVAAVQFRPEKGRKAESLRRVAALARQARGADLVVLPEMCATGYVFPSREAILPCCEGPDGETFAALAPVARELGAWLVAGFPEVDRGRLFNSALVIDPAGGLAFVYRKTLLFEADTTWAEAGDSGYRVVDAEAGRFTVGICMDLNDDAFVRWCSGSGARAIAFPTNWLDQGTDVWSYWAWRLRPVSAALVAANTYGEDEGTRFRGRSAVLDRGPALLAAAPATGDAVIRAYLP